MDEKIRDSFVFYRSFQEAIEELQHKDQLIIYKSIANYALYNQEPTLTGTTKIVWLLIRPQLDANWRKYTNGCKGGAPLGNTNAAKSAKKPAKTTKRATRTTDKQPNSTKSQPNVNDNVNVNVNDNVNGDRFEITIPPLLSDIEHYISTNTLSVDGRNFYDYYASNGWMLGKNPMVDWRAALRTWCRNSDIERVLHPSHITTKVTTQITTRDDL